MHGILPKETRVPQVLQKVSVGMNVLEGLYERSEL